MNSFHWDVLRSWASHLASIQLIKTFLIYSSQTNKAYRKEHPTRCSSKKGVPFPISSSYKISKIAFQLQEFKEHRFKFLSIFFVNLGFNFIYRYLAKQNRLKYNQKLVIYAFFLLFSFFIEGVPLMILTSQMSVASSASYKNRNTFLLKKCFSKCDNLLHISMLQVMVCLYKHFLKIWSWGALHINK